LPGGQIGTRDCDLREAGWRARYIGTFCDDDLGALSRDSSWCPPCGHQRGSDRGRGDNQFAVVLVDGAPAPNGPLESTHALTTGRRAEGRGHIKHPAADLDCHHPRRPPKPPLCARAGIPTIIDFELVRPGIADLLQKSTPSSRPRIFRCALTVH